MNKYDWIYDNIMSEEINMNEDTGDEPAVIENINCYDAFNTYLVLIWFCIWLK